MAKKQKIRGRDGKPRWINEDGRLILRKAPEKILRAAMTLPSSGITRENVAQEMKRRSEMNAKRKRNQTMKKKSQRQSIYETGAIGRPFRGGAPK